MNRGFEERVDVFAFSGDGEDVIWERLYLDAVSDFVFYFAEEFLEFGFS